MRIVGRILQMYHGFKTILIASSAKVQSWFKGTVMQII